jgi:hypothetical protein
MATLTKKDNVALLAQVAALKPPPLNKLQRLVRQKTFTRSQSTVSNFQLYYVRARRTMPAVTTLPVEELVAMVDTTHAAGSKWAVVSKPGRSGRRGPRFKNLTTVLDVVGNRLYRANHEKGMVAFWKGVAKNRPGFVQYVGTGEVFDPSRPPPAKRVKPAPVFRDGFGRVIDVAWSKPAGEFIAF